eukprot:13973000-Alexandrium_andersonii.AAC.1
MLAGRGQGLGRCNQSQHLLRNSLRVAAEHIEAEAGPYLRAPASTEVKVVGMHIAVQLSCARSTNAGRDGWVTVG